MQIHVVECMAYDPKALIVPMEKLRQLADAWNKQGGVGMLSQEAFRIEAEIKQLALEAVVAMGIQDTPREIDASPYVVFGFIANYLIDATEFNNWQQAKIAKELRDLGREEFQKAVAERKEASPPSEVLGRRAGEV